MATASTSKRQIRLKTVQKNQFVFIDFEKHVNQKKKNNTIKTLNY